VYEGFLEVLLDDIFCVFPDPCEASRNGQNPSLVALDENFKCLSISTFGGKDEGRFSVLARDVLSLLIRKLARRTTPRFYVQFFYWDQLFRCRHDRFFPVAPCNQPVNTVNFMPRDGRLTPVLLTDEPLTLLSFSRDPLADICWAVLKRDVVRFAALEKTDRVLIHEG
jgi:hypothetical protein